MPVAVYTTLIFLLSSMATLAPSGGVTHLDKVAHLVEYGMYGGLLVRAWRRNLGPRIALPVAWGTGLLVAAADERFQAWVGRSATWGDWITDAAAPVLGSVLVVLVTSRTRTAPNL